MEFLLSGLGLGFAAAAQPGPFQAFLLGRALRSGWRGTWSAAFAPLLSDGPVVLAVLLVLARVPDWFVRGLRLAGGLFLLYLAWGVLRGLGKAAPALPDPPAGGRNLLQAALMNVLSPGPWVFWATTAGPLFLRGWRRAPGLGLSFVGGFYLAMLGVLLGLIGLFSAAGRLEGRAVRVLHWLSGLGLAGFGLYQLWSGLLGG